MNCQLNDINSHKLVAGSNTSIAIFIKKDERMEQFDNTAYSLARDKCMGVHSCMCVHQHLCS